MRKITFGVAIAAFVVVGSWLLWAFNSVAIAQWAVGTIFIPSQAGPWGDSFGAFNALFGALGFTAVIGTFLLQGRGLRLQQEDQHRQRFEASFFELLGLSRELRRNIRYQFSAEYKTAKAGAKIPPDEDDGQRFLRAAYMEVIHWIREEDSEISPITNDRISELYKHHIDHRFGSRFAPYFRVIYTILRRIHEDTVLTKDEKIRYGNLLRSQLGTYDVAMISLNGLSDVSGNLRDYVIEFRLLKYLRESDFLEFLKKYYPKETFTSRD